ncbi:MAG TPA: hypothetical protein VK528_09580 [Flavobacterium sp.]|nr:hypothetical protein [Flavobacterium sp.]
MEEKTINNKKGLLTQVAIFVVVFGIAFFGTQYFFKKDIGAELQKVVTEMNKKCPLKVDADTQIDNTQFIAPKTIQYNYTILTIDKDSSAVDPADMKKMLQSQSQQSLDNSAEMELFRKNEVTLKYNYKDKNGKDLLDFAIQPTKK